MMRMPQPPAPSADTARHEGTAFRRRLCGEPSFLLRHLHALGTALFRRLRTRATLTFAGPHRGRKRRPKWLDGAAAALATGRQPAPTELRLPHYVHREIAPSAQPLVAHADIAEAGPGEAEDAEDYLAMHRWGFLTDALLAGETDWQHPLAQCLDWIERHRDKSERCWEPYSSSERVANLLVYLAATRSTATRSTAQGAAVPARLMQFLQDSASWILQHLEYYGPRETNNHVLNNARALVMAAVALEDPAALAAGMQIFRHCLPELIMAGGFLRERSTHYQLIVLNWVLDAWRFLGASADGGGEARSFLDDYRERMVAASAVICAGAAAPQMLIGDVSPDLTPAQTLARLQRLYPDAWPGPATTDSTALLRDGWFRLAAYGGEICGNFPTGRFPPRFPTHGHADLTSFAWRHAGRDLLIDRGRYRYGPDPTSAFQTSAAAHNLPLVNGFAPLCESVIAGGRWYPLPYAAAELQACAADTQIVLSHDGFARATPVRRHTRKLRVAPRALIVEDYFEGTGGVELAFWWHFGTGFDSFDAQRLAVSGSHGRLALQAEGMGDAPRAEFIPGGEGRGWMSNAYGRRQPAAGVCLRWHSALPVRVATRFDFTPSTQSVSHDS